jgi:hypothetical protein
MLLLAIKNRHIARWKRYEGVTCLAKIKPVGARFG